MPEIKMGTGLPAPKCVRMNAETQEIDGLTPIKSQGQDLAQQFFERRICDIIIRLQNEPSSKLSFSRYRALVSFSHFTREEGRAILSILELRGIIKKNCICIHILQTNGGIKHE